MFSTRWQYFHFNQYPWPAQHPVELWGFPWRSLPFKLNVTSWQTMKMLQFSCTEIVKIASKRVMLLLKVVTGGSTTGCCPPLKCCLWPLCVRAIVCLPPRVLRWMAHIKCLVTGEGPKGEKKLGNICNVCRKHMWSQGSEAGLTLTWQGTLMTDDHWQ